MEQAKAGWILLWVGKFFNGHDGQLTLIDRQGSTEVRAVVNLKANTPVPLEVVYICTPPPRDPTEERDLSQPALMRGLVRNLIVMKFLSQSVDISISVLEE